MNDIEKRARELLAAQYERIGNINAASDARRGLYQPELAAIIAALTPPEGYVLVEASKAADSARLDFLDAMNVALNCHYGTNYGWRLILSGQITRLMSGQQNRGFVGDIDLNDQNAGRTGFPGCREAIDAARPEVSQ